MPFAESHMTPVVVDDLRGADSERNGLKSSSRGLSIPDRVAQLYYKHGLLCSTYPWGTISVAILIVLISCHPLLSMPFPGNEPEEITVLSPNDLDLKAENLHAATEPLPKYQNPARWRTQQPSFYIQQIIVRASVHPWSSELGLMDAFRGPLGEIFRIHSEVVSFHSPKTNKTLRDVCLFVEGLAPSARSFQHLFPEFSCLILSPANLWALDQTEFQDDANFLDTIFAYKNPVEVRSSVADLLFGVSLKDSGLKRYPVKTRSRVLTYALTVLLKSHPAEDFVSDLRSKLYHQFPLHSSSESSNNRAVVHIYYPERFNYLELIPLTFVYFILFLYIYYSVRKIEMVKSKLGMAFSAVMTVIASLGMSVGLCTLFGLRFTLQGRDIFPYLVIIIGLENILVLTRSVVSTPANLDVKIRVAQGLSREGWNITKNLLTEVTILTVGFFTFVPAIQEFCLFAVVALLSDFILQMLFFTTVLSIDILRMELSEIQRHRGRVLGQQQQHHTILLNSERHSHPDHPNLRPRGGGLHKMSPVGSGVDGATPPMGGYRSSQSAVLVKVPRRVQIVHFWARTRFFQRTFMVAFVIWMAIFFYKYVVVEHFSPSSSGIGSTPPSSMAAEDGQDEYHNATSSIEAELGRLQHPHVDTWKRLSYRHWPDLLAIYNHSLAGSCVALLPPIRLSAAVPVERLPEVRNAKDEDYLSRLRWKSLASALDSLDVLDSEGSDFPGHGQRDQRAPYVPSSPLEILLTTLLAIPSLAFLAYVTVVLYRCICSRHYAEWRTHWWDHTAGVTHDFYARMAVETVPLILDGHRAAVECVATDGDLVASVCLAGQLRVWDIQTGCSVAQVDRNLYFSSFHQQQQPSLPEAVVDPFSFRASPPSSPNNHDMEIRKIDFSSPGTHDLTMLLGQSPPLPASSGHYFRPHQHQHQEPHQQLQQPTSPVWCMQCFDGLVALGCANGRIEIWNQHTLQCCYDDASGVGVAKLKASGHYLLAARLNGCLESFHLERSKSSSSSADPDTPPPPGDPGRPWPVASLVRLSWARAHQQPISVLDCEGGRVVTGSQDHCIKVWRVEALAPFCSLHGHCGPITALFIDTDYPSASGSGSQDGMLCLWDLSSGTCVYSLQAHDGSVTVLTYTSSYVISLGSDDKLCVWERFQGHLLNTMAMTRLFSGSLAVLNDRLLLTSQQGSLVVWDVRSGEPIRQVRLGDADTSTFIRHIVVVRDYVICDYGSQLRIVSFPMMSTHKVE